VHLALGAGRARIVGQSILESTTLALLGGVFAMALAPLGARKARLLRSVVSRGAVLGGVGVALGLGAAYVAAPYLQDLLFETSPRDPTVFATVALVLLAVSVAASLVPALRATRIDPVTALKTD
jgi:ABC-type antimicrobial peptide transport system permease subunit